jgi:hypothetical protein
VNTDFVPISLGRTEIACLRHNLRYFGTFVKRNNLTRSPDAHLNRDFEAVELAVIGQRRHSGIQDFEQKQGKKSGGGDCSQRHNYGREWIGWYDSPQRDPYWRLKCFLCAT